MAGQINISGSTEAVQLHGNDDYTVARDFTFPDESGELLIKDANDNVPGVGAINGGPLAGMRSVIINGDFRIWQRDINFYNLNNTDRQYTSDRWQFFSANIDGSAGFHVNRDDEAPNGLQYSARITNAGTSNAGGYGSAIFEQKVEGLRKFSDSTWTLSCYVKAGGTQSTYFSLQALGDYGSGGAPSAQEDFGSQIFQSSNGDFNSTGWTRVSFTFTVPDLMSKTYGTDNDDFLRVGLFGIGLEGSQNIKVAGCQLEPGSQPTPFEMRPIGVELALCERYFTSEVAGTAYSAPANNMTYGTWVSFSTTMRTANPIVTLSGGSDSNTTNVRVNGNTTPHGFTMVGNSELSGFCQMYRNITVDAEL